MLCAGRWQAGRHCRHFYLIATRKKRDAAVGQLCSHDHSKECNTRFHLTVILKTSKKTLNKINGCKSLHNPLHIFVVFVVSLNKLYFLVDPLRQSLSHPSCTVAPPTLIRCNVQHKDPPLLCVIPQGTNLYKKVQVKGNFLFWLLIVANN